ncbi:MAG: helicase-associated domain-containing protein [Chloroflexi bacterium]|nr:helicase-associated domain-containing protein [Chloroflexota bacterium]
MPDLFHTLLKYDIGHLRIIAGSWGLELETSEVDSATEELCASFLDLEAVTETIEILPADARSALTALVESNGKIEWAVFARKYGEIREMGEGKRDRERPHLKPISIAENLFYRGILAKAFFDTDKGAQEFAYIPEDLFEIIGEEMKEERGKSTEPLGRPATPLEKAFETPASDRILDDATTLLAALRLSRSGFQPDTQLAALLATAGILIKGAPQAEKVKSFLEASRANALKMLAEAWQSSHEFDELRLIPTITCEGEWKNQPLVTREFLLDLVNAIPQNKWWSIPAFVRAIKEKFPDYQRPAGDYDSWFIKRTSDGQYLRGFAYWDQVDGALVKFFIQIMHWLGMADLASPEEGKEATSFRLSSFAQKEEERGKITVSSNGKIVVPRFFSRAVRYQISRFCEWDEEKADEYQYHVSAHSLTNAKGQGLKAEQLLSLLVKYTNGTVPPALVKALKQWDAHGTEARVEKLLVLRVNRPEILEEMRKSKASKFLGEILSPNAVIIKSGAESKVLAALAELGLLSEIET